MTSSSEIEVKPKTTVATKVKRRKAKTLIAAVTALPTSPGSDCQVPRPTDGILAPLFNSKNLMSLIAMATEYSRCQTAIVLETDRKLNITEGTSRGSEKGVPELQSYAPFSSLKESNVATRSSVTF